MKLLILYFSIMGVGFVIASKNRSHYQKIGKIVEFGLTTMMYLIVFVMGLRMGSNQEVIQQLGVIGLQSVLVTLMTIAGSILFVMMLRKIIKLDRYGDLIVEFCGDDSQSYKSKSREKKKAEKKQLSEDEKARNKKNLSTSAFICVDVAFGLCIGHFVILKFFSENYSAFDQFASTSIIVGLCFLMGLVGLNLGLDETIFLKIKQAGFRVPLVTLFAILGSVTAGILYGLISPFSIREGVAISLGFGWYTYAPGVISDAGFVLAGAVAFLHNMLRETIGIIGIPLIAQKIGYIESTVVPGVASIDICLPIIEHSCKETTLVYAMANGLLFTFTCSLFVPLIVHI